MIRLILNDKEISTDLPPGTTVLDFVRYHQNLKGTKIGCREGDCGACTVLVGELAGSNISYRSMTSCLMPLANAAGKHIVTIEGINPEDGSLTPVQQAMVDESGTQCGFCTVGFVMSLTAFCIDETEKTPEMAVSSVDGNICRCTGYKSIERAAESISRQLAEGGRQTAKGSEPPASAGGLKTAIAKLIIPDYFDRIDVRLMRLNKLERTHEPDRPLTQTVRTRPAFVSGGTDVYVQEPDELAHSQANHLFYDGDLRGIRDTGEFIEIGASVTVTDLLVSPLMQSIFPDLYKHLKLVSSTPIRNMATLAGNFVNASPIGDMTVWFLALNSEIVLNTGREMLLRQLFLDYKKLNKEGDEFITTIKFQKPGEGFYFNFEKVCKRTYLDIATVNTAASFKAEPAPGESWVPPALSVPPAVAGGAGNANAVDYFITDAHVAAGGVAPVPLYLKETSSFLIGRYANAETIDKANAIIQAEISPISDVRGSADYKRLLLKQLSTAHFYEMFGSNAV